jgi:hypothetical protein
MAGRCEAETKRAGGRPRRPCLGGDRAPDEPVSPRIGSSFGRGEAFGVPDQQARPEKYRLFTRKPRLACI